jgi:hypothetical protein
LAWSLAGLSIAMFFAGVVFAFLAWLAGVTPSSKVVIDTVLYAPSLAFPVVGALVASRRPGNAIGWICLTIGFFWMLIAMGEAHDAYELARFGEGRFSVTLEALFQVIWVPPIGLLGIYMVLLFPDGRLPSRRWRPFAWFAGAAMVLITVSFALIPGSLEGHPGVRNPFGLEQFPWMAGVAAAAVLTLPLCFLVSALSLVFRYRRSGGEVREQIKWVAFAASFLGLFFSTSLLVQMLLVPESGAASEPLWSSLVNKLRLIGFAGIPVAVGIAILKYRLYDIEIIINRALVYGPLTATLVGIYFGGVVSLQYTFRALTGSESQLAVVASTLAIAALFVPLRRRVQALIDRRFYRRKYDAHKTLEAFSRKLRDETDLEQLNSTLLAVVRATMQPEHVSLWLNPAGDRGLVTSHSEDRGVAR